MRTRARGLWLLAALAGSVAVIVAPTAAAVDATRYQVTITNLTLGQPLTPPVVGTHKRPVDVFSLGEPASFEVKEIAENGNPAPLADALGANQFVSDVVVAVSPGPPPLLPGNSITFEIAAGHAANYISFVSMLICTNDGFTGLDSLRLPRQVGDSVTVETNAYDAGTEINTEDFADIVPPCPVLTGVPSSDPGTGTSNPALAENSVIHMHAGIVGGSDLLPEIHDWVNPVGEITITALG